MVYNDPLQKEPTMDPFLLIVILITAFACAYLAIDDQLDREYYAKHSK